MKKVSILTVLFFAIATIAPIHAHPGKSLITTLIETDALKYLAQMLQNPQLLIDNKEPISKIVEKLIKKFKKN